MRVRCRPVRRCVLLALAAALAAVLAAQQSPAQELVQAAAAREEAGDLEAAASLLLEVLEQRPGSLPALLSLERVLSVQGELEALPPLVRAALEADPGSSLLNQLLLRTLSTLDRVAELERAAEAWLRREPGLEAPYREVAAVWRGRGQVDRAREVLERGRARIGREDGLALELGELYATLDEPTLAAEAWDRAVGRDGGGVVTVRRRLRSLPDGGVAVVEPLVDRLTRPPLTRGRLEAAAELAVDGGLEDRALGIASEALAQTPPGEQARFLERLARAADAAGLPRLAYWGYGELLRLEEKPGADRRPTGRLVAIQGRMAELAGSVGDAGGDGAGAGSAGAARTGAAARPREGPGAQSSLLSARQALERGDADAARRALMVAASDLSGAEATAALGLARLLTRVSAPAAEAIGRALARRDAGAPGEAVEGVTRDLERVDREERPALLGFAAGLAEEAGLEAAARSLRRRIVQDHPRSPEAPPALLALAVSLRGDAGPRDEVRTLLERLIIEHPRSALVPQARRELERLGAERFERSEPSDGSEPGTGSGSSGR